MSAGRLNLICERGANFSAVLTWRDEAGVLVSLTGYTAEMDVRSTRIDTGTQLLTLTTSNSRIALGGAAGTITLTVLAADTAALTAQTGWYDLLVTTSGGTVTRLFEGVFVIAERVTA
tara:strand:+ start:104 stop:457 length:354 start_codon:yes stop_codon:yes gene_type:complete